MIAIIDYGMGNLGSVAKAVAALGADAKVTSNPKDLDRADKIILPGVGAFSIAMSALRKYGLIQPLIKNIEKGKPYLGLCLGMQLLMEESYEGGRHKGLGIFKGKVVRFKGPGSRASPEGADGSGLKVPQMGWNQLDIKNPGCPLLKGVPDGAWMYFVHSYYVEPKDKAVIAATTDYGIDFASMLWKDNIFATQFHPEKSQAIGLKILENFSAL